MLYSLIGGISRITEDNKVIYTAGYASSSHFWYIIECD